MSDETPAKTQSQSAAATPDSVPSQSNVATQSLESLVSSNFVPKQGYASIDQLIETIKPTISSFIEKHDIQIVMVSVVAGDGSSKSQSISVVAPSGLNEKDQSEWKKRRDQALFALALEFSKASKYLENIITKMLSRASE